MLLLNRISNHVYWLPPDSRTDRPVLGAIVGSKGTLMVDAGNSPAHVALFLSGLAAVKAAPPTYLVLTHWHWDHVFGMGALDVPTFASQSTKLKVDVLTRLDWSDQALDERVRAGVEIEFCRDMLKLEWPDRAHLTLRSPDIAFTDQMELDLGGVTARIVHVGGDHAPDSSVVYVPEDQVVFLSDCLYEDIYHTPPIYTTQKLFPLIERLLGFKAHYYLEGHNPDPVSRDEFEKLCHTLKIIGQSVAELGPNRDILLADLFQRLDEPLEEYAETIDAFIAGYSKA